MLILSRALVGLLVVATGFRYTDQILEKLDIMEEDAQYAIDVNFGKGELNVPFSPLLKTIVASQRAAIVNQLGGYILAYAGSSDFREQYEADRDRAKPRMATEIIAKELAEVKKNRAELLDAAKDATGDMKKLAESALALLDDQQQSLENPEQPKNPLYLAGVLGAAIISEADYKAALAAFEEAYPATVNALLKKRLQQFLDLTADIDFDAKLVERGGVLVFEDHDLELKSYHWKLCFRSGRETIDAARAYAQR